MKNQHVEFHSHNLPQTPWVGRRSFFREVSRFCGMRRCQSWPLTKSYDAAEGYAFAPDPNLPRFLYGVNEGTNIDTDSDMPPAQGAWCLEFFCNGIHLSYCSTWRNLSVELNLELPQQLRVRHIGRSMRPMLWKRCRWMSSGGCMYSTVYTVQYSIQDPLVKQLRSCSAFWERRVVSWTFFWPSQTIVCIEGTDLFDHLWRFTQKPKA